LSVKDLPKDWAASQRELKKTLFDKADFQKAIIENADGDIPSLIEDVQKFRIFQMSERQSLLVKLSRNSEELKAHIEGGGVRHVVDELTENRRAPVTGQRSLRRMGEELEHLIKVLIPENAAAVALARSYGDLRENAEYDAAKERRRFLHRRRAELEKVLAFLEGTDFKNVKIGDGTAVLGSWVKLASNSGEKREFYILGAWDGDPVKNRIAYTTKIGEALIGKKHGDKIDLPESGTFTIIEVLPLPEELRKELADEA